jgi:hypothetical protein
MAVKKVTSRTRSTTKRAKTTRSTTTKRATKRKKAADPAPVDNVPVDNIPAVELSAAAQPVAAPTVAPTAMDERPSRFTADYYLHATAPQHAEGSVRRPGKWLIFVSRSRVDALWDGVRRAVKAGRLGHAAKVSTALPHPLARDPKKHVIGVYTGDEDDAADVRRVRDVLRALGVTWKIPYKAGAGGQDEDMTGGPATKYYE